MRVNGGSEWEQVGALLKTFDFVKERERKHRLHVRSVIALCLAFIFSLRLELVLGLASGLG